MVFPGNDIPGVMMASAMRTYLTRYAATPREKSRCSPTTTDGWRTVETVLAAGMRVAAVVDARADISAQHRALAAKADFAILNGAVSGVSGGKEGSPKSR